MGKLAHSRRHSAARMARVGRVVNAPEMVQKYAHLSSEHLAQWVDRRPAILSVELPESDTFFAAGKEQGARIFS